MVEKVIAKAIADWGQAIALVEPGQQVPALNVWIADALRNAGMLENEPCPPSSSS